MGRTGQQMSQFPIPSRGVQGANFAHGKAGLTVEGTMDKPANCSGSLENHGLYPPGVCHLTGCHTPGFSFLGR